MTESRDQKVKVEFLLIEKEAAKDLEKRVVVELNSTKAFHKKQKELSEKNYVLGWQKIDD